MIVIVPCGSAKRTYKTIAGDMYTGGYHKACMQYAFSITDSENIYILSAKYGLLTLDTIIAPYNVKMGDKNQIDKQDILLQAQNLDLIDQQVIALGGRLYTDICRYIWLNCDTPLSGLGGMGYQIQWLKQNLKREDTT